MYFSAMCEKDGKKERGEMWHKKRGFLQIVPKKKVLFPPQQIRRENLLRGDFQLLAFALKPIWRSGPAVRCAQKCRNLDRISGR